MSDNKRIAFIDLAKGFCILLVVATHTMGAIPVNILFSSFRIPLYFFLSGLFFKTYGGGYNFLIKKTNKLLIPFLFLYLFTVVGLSLLKSCFGNEEFDVSVFYGFVLEKGYVNSAIWFLLCLFEVNILFCIISLVCRYKKALMFFCCLLSGIIGYNIHSPMYLDTCLVAMPFFFIGYFLRNSSVNILYANKYDRYNSIFIPFLVILFLVLLLPDFVDGKIPHCLYVWNYYELEVFRLYTVGLIGIFIILLLSKRMSYVPYISYIGRYSIVILGIHQLVNHLLLGCFIKLCAHYSFDIHNIWILIMKFVLCVLISSMFIPVCIKYLPYFFAQKDLIRTSRQHNNRFYDERDK